MEWPESSHLSQEQDVQWSSNVQTFYLCARRKTQRSLFDLSSHGKHKATGQRIDESTASPRIAQLGEKKRQFGTNDKE